MITGKQKRTMSHHIEFLPKPKPHSGCTGKRDHSKASEVILTPSLALERHQAESEFVSSLRQHFSRKTLSSA